MKVVSLAQGEAPKELSDGDKSPVCFVSNVGLDKVNINVKGFEPCAEFSDGFVNRTPADLLSLNYFNLWIDCSKKDARKWFNRNHKLLKASGFKIVCCYYGKVENSLWLQDLIKIGCDIVCSVDKLKKLKALSAEELFSELESLATKVNSPPLTMCCGLVSLFRKKKEEE